MRTLGIWKIMGIAVMIALIPMRANAASAAETEILAADAETTETDAAGESWLEKAKGTGAKAADWLKDKAPAAKEKAGELFNRAKEKISAAQEDFREWNQRQEDEFWERTRQQLEGENAANEPEVAPEAELGGAESSNETTTSEETDPAETTVETSAVEPETPIPDATGSSSDRATEGVSAAQENEADKVEGLAAFWPFSIMLAIFGLAFVFCAIKHWRR